MPHLLASVKRWRCDFITWPTNVSLAPKPYNAAVSKNVTPWSKAVSKTRSPCWADTGSAIGMAEVHTAQTDGADGKRSNLAVFHALS